MPEGLFARIFAVKFEFSDEPDSSEGDRPKRNDCYKLMPKLDEPTQPVCIETGLIGQTLVRMVQGHCLFSGLRFQTTSYNHNGALFFLVVSTFAYQLQEPLLG